MEDPRLMRVKSKGAVPQCFFPEWLTGPVFAVRILQLSNEALSRVGPRAISSLAHPTSQSMSVVSTAQRNAEGRSLDMP